MTLLRCCYLVGFLSLIIIALGCQDLVDDYVGSKPEDVRTINITMVRVYPKMVPNQIQSKREDPNMRITFTWIDIARIKRTIKQNHNLSLVGMTLTVLSFCGQSRWPANTPRLNGTIV